MCCFILSRWISHHFCETYLGLCPHFSSNPPPPPHLTPLLHLYCVQLRGRWSEMKEADVTKLLRTENGSAACGSSCQHLIKQKNQGHFSFCAISFEGWFLRGRGTKSHSDLHFSWVFSLNLTYLVRDSKGKSKDGYLPYSLTFNRILGSEGGVWLINEHLIFRYSLTNQESSVPFVTSKSLALALWTRAESKIGKICIYNIGKNI